MRDTYFLMEQFVVTDIEDMEGMGDEEFPLGLDSGLGPIARLAT